MKKQKGQIFEEVMTSYTNPENGTISVDGYKKENLKNNTEGVSVALVGVNGDVLYNEYIPKQERNCILVQKDIKKAQEEQEIRKQKLVDDVIEYLKKDFEHEDYDVLDELLKMIPHKNLIQALPEEKWKYYYIKI